MAGNGERDSSLLMVGTVHRDPQGQGRILRLLQQEKPAIISVEISPYSRIFRAQKAAAFRAILRENLRRIHQDAGIPWREILSQSAIQGIFLLLKDPYEWRAAEIYAQGMGIILREVDLSRYSEEKLSHLPDLVSGENLRALLRFSSLNLRKQIAAEYHRARFLLGHPPLFWPDTPDRQEREAFMAEGIRQLFRLAQGQKVLHIGGWEHLLDLSAAGSLYGLLKDLHPQRVLLSEGGD
jgi:hypothetical protein